MTMTRPRTIGALVLVTLGASHGFLVTPAAGAHANRATLTPRAAVACASEELGGALTPAQKAEVGNLVEDDEWLGLAMELAIVTRSAIRESMKANVREFTGKDDYKIGDLSKEADARIKSAVADMRGKDEYELGDLSVALDTIAKEEVCKLTGKDECTRRARRRPKRATWSLLAPEYVQMRSATCRWSSTRG